MDGDLENTNDVFAVFGEVEYLDLFEAVSGVIEAGTIGAFAKRGGSSYGGDEIAVLGIFRLAADVRSGATIGT